MVSAARWRATQRWNGYVPLGRRKGWCKGEKPGYTWPADVAFADVNPADYAALVVRPSGWMR